MFCKNVIVVCVCVSGCMYVHLCGLERIHCLMGYFYTCISSIVMCIFFFSWFFSHCRDFREISFCVTLFSSFEIRSNYFYVLFMWTNLINIVINRYWQAPNEFYWYSFDRDNIVWLYFILEIDEIKNVCSLIWFYNLQLCTNKFCSLHLFPAKCYQ